MNFSWAASPPLCLLFSQLCAVREGSDTAAPLPPLELCWEMHFCFLWYTPQQWRCKISDSYFLCQYVCLFTDHQPPHLPPSAATQPHNNPWSPAGGKRALHWYILSFTLSPRIRRSSVSSTISSSTTKHSSKSRLPARLFHFRNDAVPAAI